MRSAAIPAALLLCFFFVSEAAAARLYLVVEPEKGGLPFLCLPVSADQEFRVEFLHSYDRFPFKEHYRILGPAKIGLFKMVFRSVLNGQGFVYPGARVRPDGWGEIDNISTVSDRVEFIMGSREHADHRLFVGAEAWRLSDFIEAGTVTVIRIQEMPCPAACVAGIGSAH